ncbi:YHYH domain-containing protein [Woeseia oceani]|uniref:YHYH domain-containing protein n=1 Tax=Woeseia oceani TaxID=1548547 RepID=UPI0018D3BA6F|nr:YHYH domain-containing protein [Woeseia oceani]
MSKLLLSVILSSTLIAAQLGKVAAHPGGTNVDGCHTNRRTGDYHCHTPKSPRPGRQNYCHVLNGKARCGYARASCDDLVDQFGGACRPE